MPRFPDATGYLLELRDAVGEAWFNAVCDSALASDGSVPTPTLLDFLWQCFFDSAKYTAAAAVPARIIAAAAGTPAPYFLEALSGFGAFKKLTGGLHLTLSKQLTVVFGRNGSGKSSLCQALKILATPVRPADPLHNVRVQFPGTPTFSYQFESAAPQTWTTAAGFGVAANAIKYFDAALAFKYATGNLSPHSIVEVSPFRLEVLDYARAFVTAFQAFATQRVNAAVAALQRDIDAAKTNLASKVDVTTGPFTAWAALNYQAFSVFVAEFVVSGDAEKSRLADCNREVAQLTAAASDEGIRALRAQGTLLAQLVAQLTEYSNLCRSVSLVSLQRDEQDLSTKQAASLELGRGAFPNGVDPRRHHALIAAASQIADLSAYQAGVHACPLCNEPMTEQARALFAAYHGYLTSSLQAEIAAIDPRLKAGRATLARIKSFRLSDYSACRDLLSAGTLEALNDAVQAVAASIPNADQQLATANAAEFAKFGSVTERLAAIQTASASLTTTLTTATGDRQEILNSIQAVRTEIGELTARQAVSDVIGALAELCGRSMDIGPKHFAITNYDFASRLRALTNTGKTANSELVLGTFEERLGEEYKALCGATHTEAGLRLISRGEQQDVVLIPQVGSEAVHRVLSEGEQKVHALAVFFCEAAMTPERILVFDDPVTSFDYNHVSNCCERIRDLVRDQPDTQVVVLTHNWDFFTNLQSTINRSNLAGRMSVQVLEDCATVREYTEDWDRLCNEIMPLLAGPNEPSADDKERLAGCMRRLIERLTNAYVFNEQRHQFKTKQLQVSNFQAFTKIVPLLPAEADSLRDIFANLSPPEHDDPRNFYTSRTRAQLKTWYDEIHRIKAEVEARRPRI